MQLDCASALALGALGAQARHSLICEKEVRRRPHPWLPALILRPSLLVSASAAWARRAAKVKVVCHGGRSMTRASPRQTESMLWTAAFEGTWTEVLETVDAAQKNHTPGARKEFEAGMALIGVELLNQAGGLAEATAALSGKLGCNLVACVVDGAIGRSYRQPPRAWLRRTLERLTRGIPWLKRARPVREWETSRALCLALFRCCAASTAAIATRDEELVFEEELDPCGCLFWHNLWHGLGKLSAQSSTKCLSNFVSVSV